MARGSATFETEQAALSFFDMQADDAKLLSLTRVETVTTSVSITGNSRISTISGDGTEAYATPSSAGDEAANPEHAINRKLGIPSIAGMVSVEAAEKVLIAHLTHQHDLWCASKGRDPGEYVSRYSAAAAALRALAGERG